MAIPALGLTAYQSIIGGASLATAAAGTYAAVRASKQATLPKPPQPPTQDTAANQAAQQELMLRRRRGVLANIFGGAPKPNPGATNTTLG